MIMMCLMFLLTSVISHFATADVYLNHSLQTLQGRQIRCMSCGGDAFTDSRKEFHLCLTFGVIVQCDPDEICTRTELHFVNRVQGVRSNDVMGCSPLDLYREDCETSAEELGKELNITLKNYNCYHCTTSLCNADKSGMINTREEVPTPTLPTPPVGLGEKLKCYTCGYFNMYTLKYIVACTGHQELRSCSSSAEVCGFIHIQLRKPLHGKNGTVYHVKQCIHREAYVSRFQLWTKNINRLEVREFKCFYCDKDGCNSLRTNMTNILSEGSFNPTSMWLISTVTVLYFIVQQTCLK